MAVLINKAMIEIPPKFAGKPPVNPEAPGGQGFNQRRLEGGRRPSRGTCATTANGCGTRRRSASATCTPRLRSRRRWPKSGPDLKQYVGRKLTVIAWLWARTVKSPNPAFANVDVPLASTFMLSTKKGKEAYLEPVFENGGYRFTVKAGLPTERTKLGTTGG